MSREAILQPYLKWAGGKRQLLPEINKYIPQEYNTYYEPFLGAGAVLFNLSPEKAVVNDFNEELINTYAVIRDNINELIDLLKEYEEKHDKEFYYEIRSWDRTAEYSKMSDVIRAARFIYLNRTGYNGLFRVNSKNQFNVPFGKYKNPTIVNEDLLRAINIYLNTNKILFLSTDFEEAVKEASTGDFVYFDPPYDDLDDSTSNPNFVGYTRKGFSREEQKRLREVMVELDIRGCNVLLSNSATPFIEELYSDFNIITVKANRNINSNARGRGKVNEVLVMNYEC